MPEKNRPAPIDKPMCPQARKYLDYFARHPDKTIREVEIAIGSGKYARDRWVKMYRSSFRAEEESIRQRYKVAKLRQAKAAREAGVELAEAGSDLQDPRLLRFLELYEQLGHRTKALRQCQTEGIEIQWHEIEDAMRWSKEFSRRFGRVFFAGIVEIEDEQIAKGKKGVVQSGLAVLRAYKPEQYQNKLKVQVEGTVQLTPADRGAVQAAKSAAIRRFKASAERTAQALPAAVEDVVIGEVLEEVPS